MREINELLVVLSYVEKCLTFQNVYKNIFKIYI